MRSRAARPARVDDESVLRSSPPVERPKATSEPSVTVEQSIAAVGSSVNRIGSTTVRAAPGPTAERTTRAA
jgi:hypothetical protein